MGSKAHDFPPGVIAMQTRIYTIRQLTKELRVTARTLRYYENEGMICPSRNGSQRVYSSHDRARLIIILRGRRLGFSVAEMREVARMYDFKDGNPEQMRMARRKFESRIRQLVEKKHDLEQALRQLRGCVAEINGALDGRPRTPWPDFFEGETALPAFSLPN
jgi:DNA-binding transcriptional MerR regulator